MLQERRRSEGLSIFFFPLPALSVFLGASRKFAAKSSCFLSTSASCEGKSQVTAFHIRASARGSEMCDI